jgi:hypothetical protein
MHDVDQKRCFPVACRSMYHCETVVEVAVEEIEETLSADRVRPPPGH